MKNTISKLLIFFGIFCIGVSIFFILQRYSPNRLAFAISSTNMGQVSQSQVDYPKQIIIEDLHIDLPVIPAKLKKGDWEATTDGISYLESSPLPGNKGNSILYGHNFSNLLGRLPEIKPNTKIVIVRADNSKKTFVVEYTTVVTPDQTHILQNSSDSRITIYTCTGFLDTKRFVVTALLQN